MPELRAALEAEFGVLRILGRAASTAHLEPALRKLFQQRLRVLQVRSVEALGEPAVDLGEHGASLIAFVLLCEHPYETNRRAKLPCLRTHLLCERDRFAEVGLGQFALAQFEPEFSAT